MYVKKICFNYSKQSLYRWIKRYEELEEIKRFSCWIYKNKNGKYLFYYFFNTK